MGTTLSRIDFFKKSILFTSGILLTTEFVTGQSKDPLKPLAPGIVNEFVKVAHSDLGRVKELIKEYPLLLNASWDWGGGDFETALGAAGHMGLKEMANFLLSLGARADIFVLTMLGKTDIVKSMLTDYPGLLTSKGPHGFTLLHHAQKGGKESEELLDFIKSKGLTETFIKLN